VNFNFEVTYCEEDTLALTFWRKADCSMESGAPVFTSLTTCFLEWHEANSSGMAMRAIINTLTCFIS